MTQNQFQQPNSPISTGSRHQWMIAGLVLAALGIALSIYSTFHHLQVHAAGHTDAGCNINATFSCDETALSKYSEVLGVPLGVLGMSYFAAVALLLLVALAGHKAAAEHLHGYGVLVIIGVLTSVGLGGIGFFALGTYCLVCIGVYVVTFLQLGVLVAGRHELVPPGITSKSAFNGLTTAGVACGIVIAGYNFLKPAHQPEHLDVPQSATSFKTADLRLAPKVEDIPLSKSAYAGLGEDYRKGGDGSPVVVQEFADFQCPACRALSKDTEQLHKEFGDRVLFVFRNYALDNSCNSAIQQKMHEFSCKAAVMARCAGQYGKFWAYHDLVYGNQTDINNLRLKEWAQKIGLTSDQIEACWTNKDLLLKIQDDIAVGNRLGLDSTPTIYINGRKVVGGHAIDDLRSDINDALR